MSSPPTRLLHAMTHQKARMLQRSVCIFMIPIPTGNCPTFLGAGCHFRHPTSPYYLAVSRGSPVHFTAERQPDGASVSPNMSEDSERHPGSGEALVPLVTPVPKPAFSHPPPAFPLPPWLRGPSMPGFALNAASRAPFRQPPPPLPTVVASRTFTPTTARAVEGWHEKAAPLRPSRAIEQEDVEPAASHEPPSPECVIKHPLANKWTLWWFCPGKVMSFDRNGSRAHT